MAIAEIYILWWKYPDGSGMEIERAYFDERRANEDHDLVNNQISGREYFVDAIRIVGEYNE